MADESLDNSRAGADLHEIRRINWREAFGFTHIFKSFRLSRHMTKMVIAVLAVVLTWGWGNLLDLVFTPFSSIYVGPAGGPGQAGSDRQPETPRLLTEPDAYWALADYDGWHNKSRDDVQAGLQGLATDVLRKGDKPLYDSDEKAIEAAKENPGRVRGELASAAATELKNTAENAVKTFNEKEKAAKAEKDEKKRDEALKAARDERKNTIRRANQMYINRLRALDVLQPQQPFNTFTDYEGHYFGQAVNAVLHGQILSGFDTIRQKRNELSKLQAEKPRQREADNAAAPLDDRQRAAAANADAAAQREMDQALTPDRLQAGQLPNGQVEDPLGLLASLALMGYGVIWLFAEHWVFAVAWGLPVMFIWAVAGGAIARAAALQATRDEKAGIRECMRFGVRKVFSFLASPLAPIIAFLVIGLVASVLPGLLGWIPWFGPIWIGLTFGLVLIVAALLGLLVIGLLAGGLLMAPTVAVEGSDTFDACTRSYQFVMARPWKAALYGLVAAVYGAILYLFVRFLLFLVLLVAHWIVAILTFGGGDAVRDGATHWDLIWPDPTFTNWFPGQVLPGGLYNDRGQVFFTGGDWFGSSIMWLWVALVGAILVGWVISYIISAATMTYLLLRRAEDATDLKEVYVEEPEEEEPAVESATAATATVSSPATPAAAVASADAGASPQPAANDPPAAKGGEPPATP